MPITKYPSIKFSFLTELHLIFEDLDRIFTFIEPSQENEKVFSHRIYELLLRTCTAFEAVSRSILVEEKYPKKSEDLNITDYFTLSSKYQLPNHEALIESWRSGAKILKPFKDWTSQEYTPILWYQNYNHSKHDRYQNFKEANLGTLLEAISGLLVLLYSQYKQDVFGKYQKINMYGVNGQGFEWSGDSLFSIRLVA